MNEPDPINDDSEEDTHDADGLFDVYFEYNKILRTWFVAFGIGGPAMLLVNPDVAKALHDANSLKYVVTLFLMGAGAQVIGSLINKISSWYAYYGTVDETIIDTYFHDFARWLTCQFWIDILIDIITIAAFGIATWNMVVTFGIAG